MTTDPLPQATAVDPAWVGVVDELAPKLLGRQDRTGPKLSVELARLSDLYNQEGEDVARAVESPAARLRFFFLRDLPKIGGPLAELARADALPKGRSWRVLDVGAGYGATSLGVATFAARVPGVERLEVDALDRAGIALDGMRALARACGEDRLAGIATPVDLVTAQVDLESLVPGRRGPADLIVMGLSLNEMFRGLAEDARHEARLALLKGWTGRLADGGSLIVIEPAQRRATRALMRLRDALADDPEVTVFAPCVRDGPCPLLGRDRDWCHAQQPLALPPTLAGVAKEAGLRREKLTYSYLTLRRDGRRLADLSGGPNDEVVRIVGGPVGSKGKTEWDGCGPRGRVRLRLLDREADGAASAMVGAARGDVVRVVGMDAEDGAAVRLRKDVEVERLDR